jgi:membrane associated rhomboid family serine protease
MRYNQPYGGTYGRGGLSGGGLLDEFKNAFNKQDNGLIQIILINLVVFVGLILVRVILTFSGGSEIYRSIVEWLMLPSSVPEFLKKPWTIITYFFLHERFFHFLFNMLFLYWFGRIIKEFLGGSKVVSLYVLGGLAGGIFYMLIYNLIPFFAERVETSMMLGASAGVFAVVVGAATFMPNYTIFLMFIGPVRIKYIALFYVILAFAGSTGYNAGGELAHLGGAALGFVYIKQLQAGTDWGKWIHSFMRFVKSFFVRQPKVKVSYRSDSKTRQKTSSRATSSTKTAAGETSQDEIDAILDKISQSGYESLSKDEKQKLFNASKK